MTHYMVNQKLQHYRSVLVYEICGFVLYSYVHHLVITYLKYHEINACNFTIDNLDKDVLNTAYDNLNDESLIIKCVEESFNELIENDLCSDYCPLECDSIKYEITPYLRLINAFNGNITNSLFQFSDTFKTYENVTKTFYSISVYYEDLKYTLISQEPKIELFGLISNIGGTFSLFLGFSFVTLLELFRVIFEIVYVFVKKRRIQETLNNPSLR